MVDRRLGTPLLESPAGRLWLALALFAIITGLGALDLWVPITEFNILMVAPLLVATVLLSFRATALLTGYAILLTFVTQIPQGELGQLDEWVHLLLILITAALIVWIAWWFEGWRARLHEREDRLRLLTGNTSDLVLAVDADGLVEWVSPASLTMLGFDPGELVGRSAFAIVAEEDSQRLLDAIDAARRADVHSDIRFRLLRRDGTAVWVEGAPRTVRDESGVVVGGVVGLRDVEREVAAQRALAHELEYDSLKIGRAHV